MAEERDRFGLSGLNQPDSAGDDFDDDSEAEEGDEEVEEGPDYEASSQQRDRQHPSKNEDANQPGQNKQSKPNKVGDKGLEGQGAIRAGGAAAQKGAGQIAGKTAGQMAGKVGGAAAGRAGGAAAGTAIGGPIGTAVGYLTGTLLSSKIGQRATKWTIIGAFIVFLFFFSIIFLIVFAIVAPYLKGFGGSTPPQAIDAGFENDMDMIRIAFCLDELANVDKGIDKQGKEKAIEGVLLSTRCRQVNEKAAKKTLESLANIKKSLDIYDDSSEKQQLVTTIDQMSEKLVGIKVANGVYKTTRTHVDSYEVLRNKYNELIKKLVINCDDLQIALGTPNEVGLVIIPSHHDDTRSPIHYYFNGTGPKSTKYVSPQMACYLFRLTKKWQALTGDVVEIGDASIASGIQAYGGHGQHGGGGNVDIWVPSVMWAQLIGTPYNDAKSIELAKLIRDLGGKELFVTPNPAGTGLNTTYRGFPLINVDNDGKHGNHWHICIHDC